MVQILRAASDADTSEISKIHLTICRLVKTSQHIVSSDNNNEFSRAVINAALLHGDYNGYL